jgi:hypothetical protein
LGKRYKEEKKAVGENQYTISDKNHETDTILALKENSANRVMQNAQPKSTVQKIAEQVRVNPSTVQRAEKFADEVDKVAQNVGINP